MTESNSSNNLQLNMSRVHTHHVVSFHTQTNLDLELTIIVVGNQGELIYVAYVYVMLCFTSLIKITTMRKKN
jgi:hypothetical protein